MKSKIDLTYAWLDVRMRKYRDGLDIVADILKAVNGILPNQELWKLLT